MSKQKAAFRTFDSQKRKTLWLNKFSQIKKLNLSTVEIQHLEEMEQFISNFDFSKEINENQKKYFFSWFDKGKSNFGWSDYFLISGFMMLDDAVLTESEFKEKYGSFYK